MPAARNAKTKSDTEGDDREAIAKEFDDAVNMTPAEIEAWLKKDESKEVGWPKDRGDKESVGHKSGKKIIAIKHKSKDKLGKADLAHMRKVVSYVKRHSAQRPKGDVSETPWRYSLMNWGHDPLK